LRRTPSASPITRPIADSRIVEGSGTADETSVAVSVPVASGFELSENSVRETPDGNASIVGPVVGPLKSTGPELSARKGGVPEGEDPRKRSKPPPEGPSKKSKVPVIIPPFWVKGRPAIWNEHMPDPHVETADGIVGSAHLNVSLPTWYT